MKSLMRRPVLLPSYDQY